MFVVFSNKSQFNLIDISFATTQSIYKTIFKWNSDQIINEIVNLWITDFTVIKKTNIVKWNYFTLKYYGMKLYRNGPHQRTRMDSEWFVYCWFSLNDNKLIRIDEKWFNKITKLVIKWVFESDKKTTQREYDTFLLNISTLNVWCVCRYNFEHF